MMIDEHRNVAIGPKQTSDIALHMSASDPKQTYDLT